MYGYAIIYAIYDFGSGDQERRRLLFMGDPAGSWPSAHWYSNSRGNNSRDEKRCGYYGPTQLRTCMHSPFE